ncbi:hypothetical protein VNO78_19614 [Psophocarpus tetragonolobus]|uniref:Uncharacterized protein n=1 Tax=Psophocarpus tetragonolobus TaxID=3891 RepID=A0AAN9S8F0_PSOTE
MVSHEQKRAERSEDDLYGPLARKLCLTIGCRHKTCFSGKVSLLNYYSNSQIETCVGAKTSVLGDKRKQSHASVSFFHVLADTTFPSIRRFDLSDNVR